MALTTLAGINAAFPGQRQFWSKNTATGVAGNWYSSWTLAGFPAAGSAPSSGVAGDIPTKATTGAYNFVNPASGNSYLARLSAAIAVNVNSYVLALYDRLWHNSGISSTLTTGQTIQSSTPTVPLTRPDANGASAEAWYEVYVVMGAGTPTVTLAYTDQGGNTGQAGSSGVLSTTMGVGRTGQFTLAAGDTGVRSIQTWTADATFTSGTIGLVIRRLVAQVVVPTGALQQFDALAVGLPRIYDDAALELLYFASSTSPPIGNVAFNIVQG